MNHQDEQSRGFGTVAVVCNLHKGQRGIMFFFIWAFLNVFSSSAHRLVQEAFYPDGSLVVYFVALASVSLANIVLYFFVDGKWKFAFLLAGVLTPILGFLIGSLPIVPTLYGLAKIYVF